MEENNKSERTEKKKKKKGQEISDFKWASFSSVKSTFLEKKLKHY